MEGACFETSGRQTARRLTVRRPPQLGVSAASDGVDAVGRSFVQLNLRVEHADKCVSRIHTLAACLTPWPYPVRTAGHGHPRHSREEQVLVELSVEQFYSFLKALETAQQLM
jgi:hypothetical protein